MAKFIEVKHFATTCVLNVDHIVRFERTGHGGSLCTVVMSDGECLTIHETYNEMVDILDIDTRYE